MTEKEVLQKAIKSYGVDMQLTVCIEEMSELIKELCKAKREMAKLENIAEEMADVKIMLDQLEIIFGNSEDVTACYHSKVNRLKTRMYIEGRM
jgi:NTP pyrophosphatase (non-canonical NTP hydrolase)